MGDISLYCRRDTCERPQARAAVPTGILSLGVAVAAAAAAAADAAVAETRSSD